MPVTLGLIPARSGSKGIPFKNTRFLAGRPLFAWAVGIAQQTCDKVMVTTDNVKIGQLAAQYGAGVIVRPRDLALDETPMLPVVQHALREVEADVVVLLQPTQPLRTVTHVKDALQVLDETMADSVVSVVEIPAHYSPDFALRMVGERLRDPEMTPRRRQDCEKVYSRDGTVYAIKRETIEAGSLYGEDCRALIIPSNESVNIDTEEDWLRAENMKRGA